MPCVTNKPATDPAETDGVPGADGQNATRERLMQEARRLFANEGFNAVSLRRVVQAAGASNASALHYHFGTRQALVTAVVDDLAQWLQPRWEARLSQLAPGATRPVVEALFDPILALLQRPEHGSATIRFIARLGWDFGPPGQELSAALHREALEQAERLLQPALPELDAEVLRFRLVVSMGYVYHGLADRSYLWRSPFGPLDLANKSRGEELRRYFYDYLEAGLCGPAAARPNDE